MAAQPTIEFQPWGGIHMEVKPPVNFQQLRTQDTRIVARDAGSGYPQSPETEPLSTTETAMERGRRIAAHEGYVDDRHFQEVMGAVPTDAASIAAARRLFATVQSDIFSQMYGSGSWIMKHVRGKTCTIAIQIMIHNLIIQSRVFAFPVAGETAQEALIRVANSNACLQEAHQQQARWAQSYQDFIAKAAHDVEVSCGEAKTIANEQLEYLRQVAGDPPRCEIADLNSLRTIEEAIAAFKTNFHALTSSERQKIWGFPGARADGDRPARRPNLTLSHIASVLKDAQKVVDVRRLLQPTPTEPLYPGGPPVSRGHLSMWRKRFAVVCDILFQSVVIPQEIHDYVAVRNPNVVVRAGAATAFAPMRYTANELIRNLFVRLGHDLQVRWGTKADVPLLRKTALLGKRKRHSAYNLPLGGDQEDDENALEV